MRRTESSALSYYRSPLSCHATLPASISEGDAALLKFLSNVRYESLPLSPAKDTTGHPAYRSFVVRTLWRLYTWRLTQAGRWFVWPTLGFLAYTSASLEFQSYIPLCYVCAIWLVTLIAGVYYVPRVKLTAHHADRVCAGQDLAVDLHVLPTPRQPNVELFVMPHRLPHDVDSAPDDGVALAPLVQGESQRARLSLRCSKRGAYRLQGFRVETDFPFGIFRTYQTFKDERKLLVYPKFHPLRRLDIPTGRRYQPGGVALVSILGDSMEDIGNRDYRDGDNLRDIDWRATARLNKMIVREYREEYMLRAAVILDTHVAPRSSSETSESFERAVSLCAAVGDYLARNEYVIDIFAAGPNLYHLMAGRSLAYLDQILDILACVNVNPVEPFDTIEPELTENLSRISSVICIFTDWNQTRRAFAERLRAQGVAIKAIIVREGKCTINPAEDEDAFNGIRVFSKEDFDRGIEEL